MENNYSYGSADAGIYVGQSENIVVRNNTAKNNVVTFLRFKSIPFLLLHLLDNIKTTPLTDNRRAGLRSRQIGFVFQSFHLLPHRSVLDNVAMPLEIRQVSKNERMRQAAAILDIVEKAVTFTESTRMEKRGVKKYLLSRRR